MKKLKFVILTVRWIKKLNKKENGMLKSNKGISTYVVVILTMIITMLFCYIVINTNIRREKRINF